MSGVRIDENDRREGEEEIDSCRLKRMAERNQAIRLGMVVILYDSMGD